MHSSISFINQDSLMINICITKDKTLKKFFFEAIEILLNELRKEYKIKHHNFTKGLINNNFQKVLTPLMQFIDPEQDDPGTELFIN